MLNKRTTIFWPVILVGIAACVIRTTALPPTAAPATQPTTQPVGVTLRGKVSIGGALAIQKADLSRAAIYLASDPTLDAIPGTIDHVTVAQKNKTFVPNFTVVPRGTTIEFPNWDSFDHNVFSRSKAAPAFDLDRYPRGQSKTRTFHKLGVVQIFCNIHPSMRAIVVVTPNLYCTRADAEGTFELTNVPPGKYEIVAWHERCGETRQPIVVTTEGASDIAVTLTESRDNIIANELKPKGANYGVERGLGVKRERLDLPVVTDSHPAIDPEK